MNDATTTEAGYPSINGRIGEWFFFSTASIDLIEVAVRRLRKANEKSPPAQSREPSVAQAIVERARGHEKEIEEGLRVHQEKIGRVSRAIGAWGRLKDFRDRNIPDGLTGEALCRRKAELIVELGQALKEEGFSERLDALEPGSDAKTFAVQTLRRAIDGDIEAVVENVKACVAMLWALGLEADRWLREELMYEVLRISRPPVAPFGWKGSYLEPVETLDDYVRWIDNELTVQEMVNRGKEDSASDGRLVCNAYLLVDRLGLDGVPAEPKGPFTVRDEVAILRNLKRAVNCRSFAATLQDWANEMEADDAQWAASGTYVALESTPEPDLVVVTVNEYETRAIHDAFLEATGTEGAPVSLDGRLYHDLGTINGTKAYHALSEQGSGNLGAMQQTVDKAIRALRPGAVIAAGIAFGVNKKKQAIGDILVSNQLRPYDLQRVGKDNIILRDDKPRATARLVNHFKLFAQTRWDGAKVRHGVILTGEKLIDNVDYRDQLVSLEAEAIGGEMEGAGLYVSSHEHKVDWIVIKAICDWADGGKGFKKEKRQKQAAKNAAEFLVKSLQYAPLKRLGSAPAS